jgi:hypothetical protein
MLKAAARFAILAWALAPAGFAQASPSATLEAIRRRVVEGLERLPNYICRQTVERYVRPPDAKRYTREDTLRLDVLLIEGKELYTWPGSTRFEEKAIDEVVGGGAVGTGTFALYLRHLFARPGAEISYAGEEEADGRRELRFDFRVPRGKSGYYLREGEMGAVVGYSGSFWADARTFELTRLEVHADDIPPPLTITRAGDRIEYARVRIGEADFTLPANAEMTLLSPGGDSRNVTRFEGCRQYVGESVVRFGDVSAEGPAPVRTVALPPGLSVELNLETPIDQTNAVGDPLAAVLAKAVREKNGGTLLPKGARFSGRITRIERRQQGALVYTVVGVTMENVEAPGVRAEFRGTLEDLGLSVNAQHYLPFQGNPGAPLSIWTGVRHTTAPPRLNEGVFYLRGDRLRIAKGMRMIWRTAER